MNTAKLSAELVTLCIDIYAHDELDKEITLCGNGVNPFEASRVADAVLKILGIDKDQLDERIYNRALEIEGVT